MGVPAGFGDTCDECVFLIAGKTISVLSDSERVDGSISFFAPFDGQFYAFAHQVDINTELVGEAAFFSVPESKKKSPTEPIGSLIFKDFHTWPDAFGTITHNNEDGLVGKYHEATLLKTRGYYVPIGWEVDYGFAQIYVTLEDGENKLIDVLVLFYDRNAYYGFKILDNDFMSSYGGIMYGMSGSPVLQDGHLIGAVSGASPTYEGLGFFKSVEDIMN